MKVMDADCIQVGVTMLTRFLYEGHVTVIFTKKDGTERTMICTKQLGLIPSEKHPKPKPPTANNEGFKFSEIEQVVERDPQLIVVFDVEKQEWRSFRYTTIKDIKFPDRPSL